MKKNSIIYFFALFLLSCQSEKIERSLIEDFSFHIPFANDMDDLLGENVKTIQLDTITEALVGMINKIIKHDNQYYILSDDRRILHFDNDGNLKSTLDKRGGGPDEYTRIGDFNLINQKDKTELWICDFKRIRKYALSGNSWDLTGTINFDFVINKFKIISDDFILFLTGQNEESLLLTDITGAPLHRYLKQEIPFLTFKAVQFVDNNSCMIFQLGVSNEGIVFDKNDFSFKLTHIVENEQFLTSKNLLNLFDKFGYDFLGELSNTNHIRGLRNINGNIGLGYKYHGDFFVAVNKSGIWKKIKFDNENYPSLFTLFFSESADSFILYEYPEDDNLNLTLHEYIQ